MRLSRRISGITLVAPIILALAPPAGAWDDPPGATPQAPPAYPPLPGKASPQGPSGAGIPSGQSPYRSQGPANLATPQAAGKGLPTIGAVGAPYRSEGPPSLAAMSTPQMATPQGSSGAYLGTGGALSVPSPYESTAAPGTSNPFAPTTAGGVPGQGPTPSQMFGPGGAGGAGAGGGGDLFGGSGGAASSGLGGFGSGAPAAFAMIGDAAPPVGIVHSSANSGPPPIPTPARSQIAPSVRGFKIAENQSPVPQDRVFFSFNYYNDVNKTLDNHFQANIKGIEVYRYVFGFEKTFNNGMGSIGFRLPLDNVFALSKVPNLKQGGDSTAMGDLTIYIKHIFCYDRETGSVASGGVAVTPQTAPGRFGGARFLLPSNSTSIQPFFAFLLNRDRLYFQGFTAIDVPTDYTLATLLYNDLGLGYFIYRDNESNNLITAIAPTVEVHINTPLNHIGGYNRLDKNSTPDIVDITSGLNTRIRQNSILTMGVVVPVTGPQPFTVEGTVLLNIYFGRSRRNPAPPIIGG